MSPRRGVVRRVGRRLQPLFLYPVHILHRVLSPRVWTLIIPLTLPGLGQKL